MHPFISMLMQKLQGNNPDGYKKANDLLRTGGDPEPMIRQVMDGMSPEQKQFILNQAKTYGCPNNVLSKIQNMK